MQSPDEEKRAKLPPEFWQKICKERLDEQCIVTSNILSNDDNRKFEREQIYVPLALIEKCKSDKREGKHSPEEGSKLYKPQYQEKQRFEHQAFLRQILGDKTKGKHIALIGEPGAGKTTTLQEIAFWVLEKNLGLPIWISLADLDKNNSLIDLQTYLFGDWLKSAVLPSQKDITKQELETQFEQGQIWLLLDGVDEVAASGLKILNHLSKQSTYLLRKSWVFLTCRLNVWEANINFLSDFKTYRLLDFDYPKQVHQFIDNWFENKDISKGERLKIELSNPDKARLQDLILNPLRLKLLCSIWESNKAKLPNNKAELYIWFVHKFYAWEKGKQLSLTSTQQRELNKALGHLAIKDIDENSSRFRLKESFISKELGYPDDQNSLFYLALKLGWLNKVGIAAESCTEEKVYAFFHPTFQEYFAACIIEDWDFFLPSNHRNKPVKEKKYRVFLPQWQEVILFWLGRDDIDARFKESFINALVKFKDKCGIGYSKIVDRGFYEYQAYFLAAKGVAEFESTQTTTIVEQIVDYVLFDCLVWSDAKDALMATNRQKAIAILSEYLLAYNSYDRYSACQIAEILGEVFPGNRLVVESLSEIILNATDEYIYREAINIFWRIASGNQVTIKILLDMIGKSTNEYICKQAVGILGKIGRDNQLVTKALITIFRDTFEGYDLDIDNLVTIYLQKIGDKNNLFIASDLTDIIKNTNIKKKKIRFQYQYLWDYELSSVDRLQKNADNKPTIESLITTIENSHPENSDYRLAILYLGSVDEENREKAISTLTNILENSSDENIIMSIVQSLYKIDPQNELILETVPNLIENASHPNIIYYSMDCLDKFDEIDDEIVNALATIIQKSDNERIIYRAAEYLGNIDPGNKIAIAKLIDLIETNRHEYKIEMKLVKQINNRQDYLEVYEYVSQFYEYRILSPAEVLCTIAPENEIAHDNLINLIKNSSDERNRQRALDTLTKTINESSIRKIVTEFKQYLLSRKYKNSLKIMRDIDCQSRSLFDPLYDGHHKFCWHFEQYYDLVWLCSKQVSYQEFYQIWNQKKLINYLKQECQKIKILFK